MIWIFGPLGVCMLFVALAETRTVRRLRRHGMRTEGTVAEHVRSRSQSNRWESIVVFTDNEGHRVKCAPGTRSRRKQWRIGSTVPLLYLPGRPKEARVNLRWRLWWSPLVWNFCAAACFVGPVFHLLQSGA